MQELLRTEDIVLNILRSDKQARNSDDYLYFKVCQWLDNSVLNCKLGDVLLSFKSFDLPRYASVGRARRKLQAAYPELRADGEIEDRRLEHKIMFEEYARSEIR